MGRNATGYVQTSLLPLDKYQITWESLSTQVNKLDILYSLDFGNNYVPIAEQIDNVGYFNWTLPNADSDQALIRINAYGPTGQNLGSDTSNSPFIIRNYQPTYEDVSTNSYEYNALYISQSIVGPVSAGERFQVNVTFKNTGTATWYRNSDYSVHLGTANPRDRYSVFLDNSWLSTDRPAMLYEDMVAPGEIGTFVFYLTAPQTAGVYHEAFAPVAEGLTWMDSSLAIMTFQVN